MSATSVYVGQVSLGKTVRIAVRAGGDDELGKPVSSSRGATTDRGKSIGISVLRRHYRTTGKLSLYKIEYVNASSVDSWISNRAYGTTLHNTLVSFYVP